MPRKITALRAGAKGRTVTVELDGTESFRLGKTSAAGLFPGQSLEPQEIERLRGDSRVEEASIRCLGLLARRPRSRAEIERYLQRRKLPEAEIRRVVDRLSEHGWIDDRKFARAWVENRQEFRPRSARALHSELRRFGIPETDAREALEGVREEEAALSAARKKAPRLLRAAGTTPEARRIFQQKMAAHLASRGFAFDLSRETARAVWDECAQAGAGDSE
ncbi:MAG: regulatory protein RecX [Anaerolineales bacterium]|nr:regulatory protein RecX [Anaerolineales bacterium]